MKEKNLMESSFLGEDLNLEEHFEIDLCATTLPLNQSPERIEKGIVAICLEGNAFLHVDGIRYTIEPGMVLSFFPKQMVEQLIGGHCFKIMYFSCSTEILRRIFFRFPPEFMFFLREYPVYKLPEKIFEHHRETIQTLYDRYCDKDNIVRNEIILSLVRLFYLEVYNKIHNKLKLSSDKKNRHHEIFRDFINLLTRDCKRNREVQYYAEKLNITPKYLSVVTQSIIDQGAKKVIDSFVLMELKLFLKSTTLSIQEIVDVFNFPDQAFLTKFFKNQTRYTPMQYRNS